ncbi:unnamed protein product [Effrenium voratum]|nr:unnamed protein product [Effrenium voratum]
MEALDADVDAGEDFKANGEELRKLICSETDAAEMGLDPDELEELAGEGGEVDPESDEEPGTKRRCVGAGPEDQPLYPKVDRLPPHFKKLWVGKYGDPTDAELWDWYTVKGHREVHVKAPSFTTGALKSSKRVCKNSSMPFTSRPCRIRDVKERKDRVVPVTLAEGVSCRLFIPEHLSVFFEEQGGLRKQSPTPREVPFTILTPSFGRSAVDDAVGLLDLSGGMVDAELQPLDYLHIVAVKPSEVEKYRMSAPFFVVMELPTVVTVQHPQYGGLRPEELGVGCARHWLVRLAAALKLDYAFFLDDSVRAWRGVTLVEDPLCPFGLTPGPKARFNPVPLASVLQYLAEPGFLQEEMPKLAAFGFARLAPELMSVRRAFSRAQVYSGFLLNISKVEEDKVNYKQELFVWEDLVFNFQAFEVVRSNRFAMMKQPFSTGGCSAQVARSANPHVRAGAPEIGAPVFVPSSAPWGSNCGPMVALTESKLDADAFPAFGGLLEACQDYASLSGGRFQGHAFEKESGEGDFKAAVRKAAAKVREFRKRLHASEPALLETVDSAYRLVMAEGVRAGIVATCQEMGLWPSNADVPEDDCSFQDTSAPLPVIAQRAFNDQKRREEELLQPLQRKATTASFIVDFFTEAGLQLPSLSENHRDMLDEFMKRVEEWSATTSSLGSLDLRCPMLRAQRALAQSLASGGRGLESAQRRVAQRWAKNWDTPTGTALNVATAALAVGATLAALKRARARS